MITDRIGRYEVLLPITHNFNKIGDIKALFSNQNTRHFKIFFNLPAVKKKPFKRTLDVSYCPIKLSLAIKAEIRAVDSQSDLRILF